MAETTTQLTFSVDAALLAELGERLVGEPHIALGELIKNGYDADAAHVRLTFTGDELIIEDDGHGMTFDEFDRLWMRVGSTHKSEQRVSRGRGRALTGSKGVGRLAVQFLARRLTLLTCAGEEEVEATVFWPDAARPGAELVETPVTVTQRPSNTTYIKSSTGTRLVLSQLNHSWASDDFRRLAQEIWTLQPPFRAEGVTTDFEVTLETGDPTIEAAFDAQLRAVLDIWTARLVGKVHVTDDGQRKIRLTLEFTDGSRLRRTYDAPDHVDRLDFEIRVFNLVHRQPMGIRVGAARAYFNQFGGVHVYDAGFRLPYYGPETDWLGIEQDHSHRLSVSDLLPSALNVTGGLSYLPTNSRLFGVVNVDTGHERHAAAKPGESLSIAVTRDRLVANIAYRELRSAVRWALDFYAMQEAQRRQQEEIADIRAIAPKRARIRDVLERYRDAIPANVFGAVSTELEETIETQEQEVDRAARRAGLLGALATAGIAAVAFEHEISKQITLLEELAEELAATDRAVDRHAAALSILEWVERARATRRIFSFVMDSGQDEPQSMQADQVCGTVIAQMGPLLRGLEIDQAVPPELRLPEGRFSEWAAILQNVLINAANATLDASPPRVRVDGHAGRRSALLIHDNGVGVDLSDAEELFEPFVRRLALPPDRQRSGLGGTGLGLTIVRMLATTLNCQVQFIGPKDGFTTTFEISWQTD
jgi:signal transduction histidine kinase